MFHGRHFVCHLGICNPVCVKLLQAMSGVIPRNFEKKRRLYLKPFSWRPQTRHTHRHTHTSMAIGEMQCITFRLQIQRTHLPSTVCKAVCASQRSVHGKTIRKLKKTTFCLIWIATYHNPLFSNRDNFDVAKFAILKSKMAENDHYSECLAWFFYQVLLFIVVELYFRSIWVMTRQYLI